MTSLPSSRQEITPLCAETSRFAAGVRQYRPNLRVALQDGLAASYISGRRKRAAGTTRACSMVGTLVPRSLASASASLSG